MQAAISPTDFLRQVRPQELIRLFELLPDVSFFIKDRQGRFMALNRRGCDYCGVRHEREAFGRTDHDFFPRSRARAYAQDDRAVMAGGEPIINRLESAPEAEGSPHLVFTSKLPLRDRQGRIIGVAGFSRQIQQVRAPHTTEARLAGIIEHMHRHPEQTRPGRELARMAGLSQSQFDRCFRRAFNTSPRQYLLRVRVEAACRRLSDTDDTAAAIAQDLGFYDHAHLARSFRRIMGVTPTDYRSRHRSPHLP